MLIQKHLPESKVKSINSEGELAITRAFVYREKDKTYNAINFTILYFSEDNGLNDECVRYTKDKFVYKRQFSIKLDTLMKTLNNVGLCRIAEANER